MKRYIRFSNQSNTPKSFGAGPVIQYDGERIRKTNLTINQYGRKRIVYEDVVKTNPDGSKKLYYKYDNQLNLTDYSDCYDPQN